MPASTRTPDADNRDRMTTPWKNLAESLRQKNRLLFSLLGLLVLVEVITVLAVLASQQYATDRALTDHTHELLQNVVDETRENAVGYLRQAQDSVSLATGVFQAGLLSQDEPADLERYFLEQLRVVPQIDALYFGDLQGNFIFSKRQSMGSKEGFFSKIIQTSLPPAHRVTLVDRTPGLVETSRSTDPTDKYDPRLRPWFELARDADGEVWTAPYIFYTSQLPGLTVARAVRDTDGKLLGVMGADIELSALSEFLTNQRVGSSGVAFIVYSNGDVLAHPRAAGLALRDDESKLRLKRLSELDAVTAQAGAHLGKSFPDLVTLSHTHFDTFEAQGKRYLSMFVPLLNQGRNQWVMGIYAPEDEMAGTIRRGQRESIFLGVAVSLLTITAAILVGLFFLRPLDTLQRQAREDPLTDLLNRRSFDEIGASRLATALRAARSCCAIMIDIDRFKPINDGHGHAVGDEVLLAVARRINRGLSDEDMLSRYGGEEFAILLPGAELQQGISVAERLRDIVGSEPIKTSVGPLKVTISLGVAQTSGQISSIAELLERADQGLLAAKRQGRDCVVAIEG
ncbi:MAG: diguanylate cyclase [Sedimenticolaceae bacterium]